MNPPRDAFVAPGLTGHPLLLRRPGQSRRSAAWMWTRYLAAHLLLSFLILSAFGLAVYPVTLVIYWLRLVA